MPFYSMQEVKKEVLQLQQPYSVHDSQERARAGPGRARGGKLKWKFVNNIINSYIIHKTD